MSALPALPNMLGNIARGTCRALAGRRHLGSLLPSAPHHELLAFGDSFNPDAEFILGFIHSYTAHVCFPPRLK
jgi:hypothetical protein